MTRAALGGSDGICAEDLCSPSPRCSPRWPTTASQPSGATRHKPLLCGAQQLIELTDQFLASGHVVALTDGGDPLFTTVEVLEVRLVSRHGSPRASTAEHTSFPTRMSMPPSNMSSPA